MGKGPGWCSIEVAFLLSTSSGASCEKIRRRRQQRSKAFVCLFLDLPFVNYQDSLKIGKAAFLCNQGFLIESSGVQRTRTVAIETIQT